MTIFNPTLTLDDSGRYQVRYHDGSRTRYRSCRTSDAGEAAAFLGRLVQQDAADAGEGSDLKVVDLLERYRDDHVLRHGAPSNRANHLSVLGRLSGLKGAVADVRAAARQFEDVRRERGVSDATIRKELLVLKAALSWAVDEGLIGRAPKIPLPAAGEPKPHWLDQTQARALLDASAEGRRTPGHPYPRVYLFVLLGLATGARRRSLETLRWSQIDLDAGVIDFANGGAATAKRKAVTPLPDRVCGVDVLAVLREAQQCARTEYVLYSDSRITAAFDTARRKAGLEWATPHTLKHTKATWMLGAGVSVWDTAKVLRTSIAQLERTYGHAIAANMREAVNQGCG